MAANSVLKTWRWNEKKRRKKLKKCYFWSAVLCGAENWTLRKVDQRYFESF